MPSLKRPDVDLVPKIKLERLTKRVKMESEHRNLPPPIAGANSTKDVIAICKLINQKALLKQ